MDIRKDLEEAAASAGEWIDKAISSAIESIGAPFRDAARGVDAIDECAAKQLEPMTEHENETVRGLGEALKKSGLGHANVVLKGSQGIKPPGC
jgi:hypothetical protein